MKKILFSWWYLAFCFLANAQVITVRDSVSNQPLELVTLVSEKPFAFTTTNAQGQADISAFRDAEKILIRMLGYETKAMRAEELQSANLIVLLKPSGVSLDQVVVSSTKWNQMGQDVPNKISSISAKQVALQNPQTAADMLGASGEVFIQKSQQGGGSPMIRGFSTNRLLYSFDGVRMNTAIFRSGNIQNVISLDPFAMEKTEILFGSGSVIYGSDAIGGVMSFQTLTPQLSLSDKTLVTGKAVARFASANTELTGHFDVNVGWKKWSMLSSFSFNDYNDLRMGKNGPDEYLRPFYVGRIDSLDVLIENDDPQVQAPTGYQQINMMQKLRFKPNEKWDLQYAFHYSATTDNPRYDRLIRMRNGLPRSAEWYYGPQVWMMNQLTVTHSGNNVAYDQLAIRFAQQRFEESRHDRDINDTELRNRMEEVDAWSVNVDFNKSIGSRHQLFYGLEFVLNDVASTGTDEDISTGEIIPGPARYPQSTWSSYGAYAAYHFNLNEKLMLQAGLRYNQFMIDAEFDTSFYPFPYTTAGLNDGAVTGNVGVVYNPTKRWTLRGNFSTGFRAPNVDDFGKVFDSEPGSMVVPNPDLQSEYAYNFEAGIAKVFGDDVKIDLTGYYTILNDAMVRRNYTLNGQDSILYDGELSQVQAVQNAAVATVYGVQASIEVKLPAGFGFSSVVNFQKGEEELDNGTTSPSRHAAPVFGRTYFTYTMQKLKIDLYADYSGQVSYENLSDEGKATDYIYAVDGDGNPYSPCWYTLNFKVMYQINANFSVSGGVENLTDQRYRPYSSGIAAAGRNFVLALRANF
ncbi:MAG: TonB-dependent receptor [Chitinophagales bacterium]|nr:TonB-dependent receptor [Chitinophagales bacterium]